MKGPPCAGLVICFVLSLADLKFWFDPRTAKLTDRRRRHPQFPCAAAAWMLIQVANIIFPRIGLGDTAVTNTILVLAIGFIPAVVISWFFELTPEGLKLDSDVSPGESIAPQTSKTLDRLIVVMLVLAVGFLAVDKFVLDPARDQLDIEAATEKGRTEAILGSYGDKSIAVLSFEDMSPAQDQEYFSDGIAEELLNVLATIRELRVISRR